MTYTNLPVNPTLITQSTLNGVNVNIQVMDAGGIITSNSYIYDAFGQDNFTWEVEDYDFGGGMYIDNPALTFIGPAANTYYQEQTAFQPFIDAVDNGGGTLRVYRDPIGTGAATGSSQNPGELMRQKVLDAFAVTNITRDVNVGFFDGGTTGSGIPNCMNYTRTYPTGSFNVYLRVADGAGQLSPLLDQVTDGWGTSSQTTTNLGTFPMVNSGGWDNFTWVPLRDGNGNLVRVTMGGTNTLRLTAGSTTTAPGNGNGGGNVNFLMLTPANTNLPVITGVYPNGTNQFQVSSALTFTASSPGGFTINPAGISVTLTIKTLLGQTTVTNLTSTNGLVVTGTSTSRNVSAPLATNLIYTAVISVKDVNGSPANKTVSFDTCNPNYTWEAEDYNHDNGQFIDNPAPDAYANLTGVEGVDCHNISDAPNETFVYRNPQLPPTTPGVGNGDQVNSDVPRLQYITSALSDYNLGWYDGGEWDNYTRTFPAGQYNVFLRAANGSGGNGSATLSVVSGDTTTANQTNTTLGTFTIPSTGANAWQTYTWVPLRDAGGNLVQFTGGSLKTLRAASGGNLNPNFYALFPANTNLPNLNNIYPSGGIFQSTNKFAFAVSSAAGVATNNIVVTINGVTVTNLAFSGSLLNWAVSYPHLQPNTAYTVTISVTDLNGNIATTSSSFDTFSPANYTWEAEDFDHDGGQFIDNPQTNAYFGLPAATDVDTHQVNFAAAAPYLYRTNALALPGEGNGMATEINGDVKRAQYLGVGNTNVDYTMGYFSGGANASSSWANYTRYYPAGSYNVYGRLADGALVPTTATLSQVTSGWGTPTQTTNLLGTFAVPNTGWESYNFVPLRDDSGNLVTLTFDGSTNTLQVGNPLGSGADVNVNFLMLAPVFALNAVHSGTNATLSFPAQSGFNYQVQYKTNLTDPNWASLGGAIAGTNAVMSVNDPITGGTRFYRVQVQ